MLANFSGNGAQMNIDARRLRQRPSCFREAIEQHVPTLLCKCCASPRRNPAVRSTPRPLRPAPACRRRNRDTISRRASAAISRSLPSAKPTRKPAIEYVFESVLTSTAHIRRAIDLQHRWRRIAFEVDLRIRHVGQQKHLVLLRQRDGVFVEIEIHCLRASGWPDSTPPSRSAAALSGARRDRCRANIAQANALRSSE